MSDRGFVIEVLDYLCAAGRSRRRLLPGIRLNLSKRAPASISAGRRRGLWFNGSAWHEDEHRTAWDGLQCMSDTRPYGAGKRWPSILWAAVGGTMLLAIAGFVLHASAQTLPASPAPLNGSQWSPIRETMHDLIKSGYALTAVSGVTVNGDVAANHFYLLRGTDLVRCGEVYGTGSVGATVFPCERLVAPRPSK
jgi:hypothetical protein